MSSIVITEGDVDRTLVEALDLGLDVLKPKKRAPGREAAIQRAADAAMQVGSREIILMLDWNSHTEEELIEEVTKVLSENWERPDLEHEEGKWSLSDDNNVRLVKAGIPDNRKLQSWGIDRFMADDYLLELCLRDDSLAAFCRKENNLSWTPGNAAELEKLLEATAKLFKESGIKLSSSKRYVHIIKAAIGFEAARATFAQELIKRAPDDAKAEVLGALRSALVGGA